MFFVTVSLWGQNQNDDFQKFINEYRINKEVPSIAAGLSQNGNIVWMGSSGYINLENNVPANNNRRCYYAAC
jgi:CubicO group peptidase (beta-lactamase class C family)